PVGRTKLALNLTLSTYLIPLYLDLYTFIQAIPLHLYSSHHPIQFFNPSFTVTQWYFTRPSIGCWTMVSIAIPSSSATYLRYDLKRNAMEPTKLTLPALPKGGYSNT